MTAPQGIVEIEITRQIPAEEPPEGEEPQPAQTRVAYARLLTPELQQLIERQNIDCADINSMKWPLFGLSRHATCKLLLLQRDLMDLLTIDASNWRDTTFRPSKDGFRIWFIVGSKLDSLRSCFNRMHIADIQPLMVSAFGKTLAPLPPDPPPEPGEEVPVQPPVPWGEAMYIVTFKCDRWAARGNRAVTNYPLQDNNGNKDIYARSWDPSDQLEYSPYLDTTCEDVVEEAIKKKLGTLSYGFWQLYRSGVDNYDGTLAGIWPEFGQVAKPSGMGNYNRKSIPAYVDEICSRVSACVQYVPIFNTINDTSIPGKFSFVLRGVNSGVLPVGIFLSKYGKDIIAGCIKHDGNLPNPDNSSEYDDRPTAAEFPNVIRLSTKPKDIIVATRWEQKADGRPPDVFRVTVSNADVDTPDEASWFQNGYLNNPFSNAPNFEFYNVGNSEVITNYPSSSGDKVEHGDAYVGVYHADTWTSSPPFYYVDRKYVKKPSELDAPFSGPQSDIYWSMANRINAKYKSGVCDLWLRSWIMPEIPWPGANWIELRLQLDGKGFPFPVTHLYGDIDDPLLGPVPDDGTLDIEPSGMVQTWRGEDGRQRIHVGMPFGIPCLIRIVGNESIGDNAWKYTAKIVFRNEVLEPAGYHGGLREFNVTSPQPELEIIAYNLCEAANSSSFAGPGYKIPLVQDGFNVLPIGEDRDGVLHDVIVQAMLYMDHSGLGLDNKIQAYFSMHNAIDGECDTSAFVEPTYDGGSFDGGA